MRNRTALLLSVLLLLLAACGGSAGRSAQSPDGTPEFTAPLLTGGMIDSASFAGKPTALWFWAPWCTVCRAESGDVAKAADEFEGRVDLIGVGGLGEVPAMRKFVEQTGTGGFRHVVDKDGSIWASFGVTVQPAFAFIHANGTVDTHVGSLDHDEIVKRLNALSTS